MALVPITILAALVTLGRLGAAGDLADAYARRSNSFSVSDPAGRVVAADLRLCGATRPLHRAGRVLKAVVPITCEGHGDVRVRFADGSDASCLVGYVTPGAVQHFRFAVKGTACIWDQP